MVSATSFGSALRTERGQSCVHLRGWAMVGTDSLEYSLAGWGACLTGSMQKPLSKQNCTLGSQGFHKLLCTVRRS